MVTNCVVICAGESTRWNNYLGVPKHLVNIGGETVLERIVNLIHQFKTDDVKVSIMVKDLGDERYYIPGATTLEANLTPDNLDADKFLSSMGQWSTNDRTIVFYGDVWFSEEAMKTIMEWDDKDWILFGSSYECFAQSFYPKDMAKHLQALLDVRDAHVSKKIDRCGGWEHYRQFNGYDLIEHTLDNNFYLIEDMTDDFDFPRDYDEFMKVYNESKDIVCSRCRIP